MQASLHSLRSRQPLLLFLPLLLLCGPTAPPTAAAERLSSRSYHTLPSSAYAYCVRRFNGTHQVGCSSRISGNVGRLVFVDTAGELEAALKSDASPGDATLALPAALFAQHWDRLHGVSGGLQGLIVLYPETLDGSAATTVTTSFSEDATCPNARLSAYRSPVSTGPACSPPAGLPWNANGTAAALRDWPYPVLLLANSTEIDLLRNCTARQSSLRQCAIELRTPMFGAASSVACLRRAHYTSLLTALTSIVTWSRFCGPLGDFSLAWSAASGRLPTAAQRAPKSVILLLARLDAFSMFARHSPAVATLHPGLTVMLAVANSLSRASQPTPPTKPERDVVLLFVNADSWDYIGSQRLANDLHSNRGLFGATAGQPAAINASHVHSILELGELADLPNLGNLSGLTDSKLYADSAAVRAALNATLAGLGLPASALVSNRQLPPASVQTFLRPPGASGLSALPALVLADHAAGLPLRNPNYHSFADLRPPPAATVDTLGDLADRLAAYLGGFLAGNVSATDAEAVKVDRNLMRAYTACLAGAPTCPHALYASNVSEPNLRAAFGVETGRHVGSYVYEFADNFQPLVGFNQLRYLTHLLLGNATGTRLANVTNRDSCLALNSANDTATAGLPIYYAWTLGGGRAQNDSGACMRLSSTALPAVSPISDEDFNAWDGRSNDYATWTESRWEEAQVRLFMRPSTAWGMAHLAVGLAVLLVSLQCVLGARHGLPDNVPSSLAP